MLGFCEIQCTDGAERRRNPFVSSPLGGRTLSGLQLPWFLLRPPMGYGVLTTTGRKTGKRRRRCVRAIRAGDKVYLVAIKGGSTTGWAKNVRANQNAHLRVRGGRFACILRPPRDELERQRAQEAYCENVELFDYLTYTQWRRGWPRRARIEQLLCGWFDDGSVFVAELVTRR